MASFIAAMMSSRRAMMSFLFEYRWKASCKAVFAASQP
jgi:hypothetical protein